MNTARRKRHYCLRGHDTAMVGRNASGQCNQCKIDYDKERHQKSYVLHPIEPIQFCPHGHDTFKCGRTKEGHCRQCDRDRAMIWFKNNSDRAGIQTNIGNWRRKGVIKIDGTLFTLKDYEKAYKLQKGKCLICGEYQPSFKKALCVDHDHKTKLFRGLLCTFCNIQLGLYEKHSTKFAGYLARHEKGKLKHGSK